ncbi:alpha/beta-hydrolase [Rhizoclosmatium globosum]|uniref:Alpha/beta-hydrolase n=1 Tax=Rhizoclosmatium globosum TaxID=329046 RepID=A0A1Y2CW08_9FUNG|nr:alpha/beta-hydrolase [Rhizoclosmatium globosum]|eukprot:ORY51228.1 alpha/beta-hydrolase [Rhizoclosmatium globosum]
MEEKQVPHHRLSVAVLVAIAIVVGVKLSRDQVPITVSDTFKTYAKFAAVIKNETQVIASASESIFAHQTLVVVSPSLKAIVVSLMGTNSTGDVLEDAQILLIQFPNPTANDLIAVVNRTATISEIDRIRMFKAFPDGQQVAMVHRGFYGEWLAVKPMLLPALGGAMAVVGAADAVLEGLAPAGRIRIITFGQPRVGNPAFRDLVNGMNGDGLASWGFNHISKEYFVTKVACYELATTVNGKVWRRHGCMNQPIELPNLIVVTNWKKAHLCYLGLRIPLLQSSSFCST